MGYLTETVDAEIYRSVTRVDYDPATGTMDVLISEGVDVPQVDGSVRWVPTGMQSQHRIAGAATIDVPLSAMLALLGLANADELAALTAKQLVIRLLDAALA